MANETRSEPQRKAETLAPALLRLVEATLRELHADAPGMPSVTLDSVNDADRLAGAVAQGRPLAFFPEGTFTARPGLLPFHLGAFLAAARAGVPVLPVALLGHRDLLPAGRWWPGRARLVVEICARLMADPGAADAFAAAVRLRDAARRVLDERLEAR